MLFRALNNNTGAGIIFIIISILVVFSFNGNLTYLLPTIAAIGFGIQRLIPSLQSCYSSYSQLLGNFSSLSMIVDILDSFSSVTNKTNINLTNEFKNQILLKNVCLKYENDVKICLNNINLKIIKGQRIGLIGKSGSGKSSLINLISGLINPNSGEIYVDDKKITNYNRIGSLFSVIHQNIYITNKSIAENIAIGISPELINH